MIDQYNKYMGGVDRADQLITYYGFHHFSKKWWKRVFFHLLDVSFMNAYLVYCSVTAGTQRLSHMDFRLAPNASHVPRCLLGRDHFPEPGKKRDCKVCSSRKSKKRKVTSYQCCSCKVPLCVHSCFRKYHMHKNYK